MLLTKYEERKQRECLRSRKRRMENPEKEREKDRKYYLKNKEKLKARCKKWYGARTEDQKEKGRIKKKEWSSLHPEKMTIYNRTRRMESYGITLEDYARMYDEQWGMCGICGKQGESQLNLKAKKNEILLVDHCHNNRKVRALLCHYCNSLLGMAKENEVILENAINYLKYFE